MFILLVLHLQNICISYNIYYIHIHIPVCVCVCVCVIKGKALRPVLEGFGVTMYGGACEELVKSRGARFECIVTTNPDRSTLIMIITWHFQFRLVNVSILHLKGGYRARSESTLISSSLNLLKNYHNKTQWYESANIIIGSNVAFDTNDCWNYP